MMTMHLCPKSRGHRRSQIWREVAFLKIPRGAPQGYPLKHTVLIPTGQVRLHDRFFSFQRRALGALRVCEDTIYYGSWCGVIDSKWQNSWLGGDWANFSD